MVQKKEEQGNIFLAAYEGKFNEVKALVEDNKKIINSKDEDERSRDIYILVSFLFIYFYFK